MAELILVEGLIGIPATPLSREPREAACLPLRDVLEDMAKNDSQREIYAALLRLLDLGALLFDWVDCDGIPIRLWKTNGDIALLNGLEDVEKLKWRPTYGVSDLENLEQLVMGNFVFTIDLLMPIQFGGRL